MSLPPLRPLSFGEILDGAFTLYRRNFVTFAVTALIPTAVLIAGMVLLGGSVLAGATSIQGALGGMLLLALIAGGSFVVMYGALAHQAAQAYTGRPTSVGDGLRAGLRSALPLIGATFLAIIGVMVLVFALSLVTGVIGAALARVGGAVAVLFGIIMFFVIMAVYLCVLAALFAVVPAVVVEGAGPIGALERSVQLARGALGRVIGLLLVTVLITYLPIIAVVAFTTGAAALTADPMAMLGTMVTQQVLAMAIGILTVPFMMSVIVLLYYDRRVRTEALDVQMAADGLAVAR